MDAIRREPRLGPLDPALPEPPASPPAHETAGPAAPAEAPAAADARGHRGYPDADETRGYHLQPERDDFPDWALRDFLARLWRRKALVLATVTLATLATAIVVFQITPRYSASARILVGTPKAQVVDIEAVLGGLGTDQPAVRSEVQILGSRALAAKVVEALDLTARPEFNPSLRPPSLLSALDPLGWLAERLGDLVPEDWRGVRFDAGSTGHETTPEALERRAKIGAQNALQRTLSVEIVDRSRVISVTATSEDPELAAAIANALSDLYLLEQLEAKFEATKRATEWLSERTRELRGQVEASERAVEAYRRQHGLVRSGNTTVTGQQISEINTQLILARTQTAEAGARLRQVRALLDSEGGVESAAEVLASPLIQRLRERETDVARRAAEMATEYGPRHPKMITIKAELEDLRARVEAEVGKIVRGLGNELEVARTRERTLERNLEKLKAENATNDSAQARLRILEREAAANRALFETFLARWKETGRQDEIQHADARIISRAEVPGHPSSPRKKLIVGVALAASGFLALILAHLVELLDRGFRSSEQIEHMTGFGTLAWIPLLTRRRIAREPWSYVLDRPASAFSESLRTLHTGVLLSRVDTAPKSILITSSVPNEGKTTIAIAMARLLARSGRRVLLVDGDLRRNRVAGLLDLSSDAGLVEAAADPETLGSGLIQRDTPSGLHVLTAGGNVPNPLDLIGSAGMRALISELRRRYDLVIVDSPPILIVSDARILARLTDTTVFVVRWAETRRETVALALMQLAESGASLAGVALSMVNIRKNASYAYGDSAYYHGSARTYRQYYAD